MHQAPMYWLLCHWHLALGSIVEYRVSLLPSPMLAPPPVTHRGVVSLQVDGNDQKTPGWRFNYWELKGVPVRIEVGPRDVEQSVCVLARRDRPGEVDAES